jgi:predicted amidohydrolase YtcJ
LDGQARVLVTGARIVLPGGHRTDALLIDGERIAALGQEAVEAARGAAKLELPGVTVLPGFIDAHTHLIHQGLTLGRLALGTAGSSREVLELVAAALADHDPGRLLIAEDWDDTAWPAGDRLERAALDRLAPRTPVILRRVCGHLAVANGAALARISAHPAASAHAANGLLAVESGVLIEDAAMRLRELFPPDEGEIDRALARAEAQALGLGVTSVHDIADQAGVAALARRRRAGSLRMRVTVHVDRQQLPGVETLGLGSGPGDRWLKLGGVKLYLDGSIGARTAALRAPYADSPLETGRLLFAEADLIALVRRIDAAGSTAVLHAIGDAAIDQALTALEALGPAGVHAARHRIEHLELTPDDLIERVARLGVTASMQPNFVDRWGQAGGMYARALGAERLGQMNRFRTLVGRGVPLAFGSDCMPMGPLAGLRGALHHPLASERLTASEAFAAYAAGGAYAAFAESETGAIVPGHLADLVLVAGDPWDAADPERCPVLATIVGGRLMHEAAPPRAGHADP